MATSEQQCAWRTSLGTNGPDCQEPDCSRAHRLCELRPPNESQERHEAIWDDGVDRWYGQVLSDAQQDLLHDYYRETPPHMVPLWMHGLAFALRRTHLVEHVHMPWDYGLYNDLALLCQYRRGPLPFEFMKTLWADMEKRRELLDMEEAAMEKCAFAFAKQLVANKGI